MMRDLHIVHLEDDENDALLIQRAIRRAGIHSTIDVVSTESAFLKRLSGDPVDLILSDFTLPGFNGLKALALAREKLPQVPFIFVSGGIGEDQAVDSLFHGASDYVLKDRLGRLPGAVKRALEGVQERKHRVKAESALTEQNELFASFMNFGPGLAFLKREDGRMLYANEPLQEWFRSRHQEWREKTENDFLPPETARVIRQNDVAVLSSNAPLKVIEVIPNSHGEAQQFLVCKFPFRTGAGERLIGGIAIDITEHRQIEQQFLRAQRMESLGILAGGIAHDLNNALLPVTLGIEMLGEEVKSKNGVDVLQVMQDSTTRAALLIRQVLTFARGANEQKAEVDPALLIRDVARIASRTFPAKIKVKSSVAKDVAWLSADPTQIHQVLMNLAVNAGDAMPDGGTLSISARNVPASETHDLFNSIGKAEMYVEIRVSDTGTGIPESVRHQIFDPFFTTKPPGKGTGLGLSTSLGIIKRHGGGVNFTSSSEGTTFWVYLPATAPNRERKPAKQLPAVVHEGHAGGAEVVLIIDDETGSREVAKMVLGRHAYQVVTASNGADGVATFERFRDRIDVVLVDHRMPLMEGPDVVRAIRKLSKKAKIIAMSGHLSTVGEAFSNAEVDAFLAKPFTAEQMLSVLREVLRS